MWIYIFWGLLTWRVYNMDYYCYTSVYRDGSELHRSTGNWTSLDLFACEPLTWLPVLAKQIIYALGNAHIHVVTVKPVFATTWEIGTTWESRTGTPVPMSVQYPQMDLRNKTTSELRTVFHSPLGVPNSQAPLYTCYINLHSVQVFFISADKSDDL